ncbi:hypothetical protein Droror1_Dr00023922 [Drosera rotundifolia]
MIMGNQKPAWLEAIYAEKFFEGCTRHETAKKNEKNVLCLDCCISICPHCITLHRFHRLLQIRRYVYHDVIRLEDLEKLIDCSSVQAYTINGGKVIFIKKRPQNRQFKGATSYCTSCDRSLQEPHIHCSLGCKVDFVIKYNKDLTPYLRACDTLQLGPDFIYPQDMIIGSRNDMTPNFELCHSTTNFDSDETMSSSSGSSGCTESTSMVSSEIVKKKRTGYFPCERMSSYKFSISDDDMASSMNRRKSIPHRSPLC